MVEVYIPGTDPRVRILASIRSSLLVLLTSGSSISSTALKDAVKKKKTKKQIQQDQAAMLSISFCFTEAQSSVATLGLLLLALWAAVTVLKTRGQRPEPRDTHTQPSPDTNTQPSTQTQSTLPPTIKSRPATTSPVSWRASFSSVLPAHDIQRTLSVSEVARKDSSSTCRSDRSSFQDGFLPHEHPSTGHLLLAGVGRQFSPAIMRDEPENTPRDAESMQIDIHW
ncbi:hypothetical protein B0T19DRAFT_59800 [Cercophora scortea]|uniref:Uncharacterized protein n=1 Tax=Cercophora scortea TaxID=314031 RepID=A0AAE0J549_9PEZI|nr:hypothetical protein B0T19DRAFT_59800 [Cercophora scortea]